MITTKYKPFFTKLVTPLARAVARTGISPTALTLIGSTLSASICVWFMFSHAVVPFCLAVTAAGCIDVLDGAVARATGRVTKFGAYLDAMCDRYIDGFVAISTAWVTGYWLLIMTGFAGALIISYAKARAAMEIPVSNQEWPDLMERGDRSLMFLGSLFVSGLVPWKPLGHDLFWWALVVMVPLVHFTAIQRIFRARRYIQAREAG